MLRGVSGCGPGRAPSKAREALLRHVLGGSPIGVALEAELREWCAGSARFEGFLAANRDKIRKKVRTAGDAAALGDVRAELLVAHRLLRDRRFEVAFEAYGSTSGGPDLTATYRTNQKVNVEVTRLRGGPLDEGRLSGVLLVKLRQLPVGMPNVVTLVSEAGSVGVEDVVTAVRLLKGHADRKEEAVFTRRGYEGARDFYGRFLRLSAVTVVVDVPHGVEGAAVAEGMGGVERVLTKRAPAEGGLWLNPEARHPLPRELATALARLWGPGRLA